MSSRTLLSPLAALALLLSVGCSDAQSSLDAYPELNPELARIGQVSFRAIPGDDRVPPALRSQAVGEALAIVSGAEPFNSKASAFVRLARAPSFADEPEAVQMITGIALNWMNNNPSQWRGSEEAIREVIDIHATNRGVMYEAMVEAYDRLDADGAGLDLAPTRASIVSAYTFRADPCEDCELAGPAEAAGPEALPEPIRDQVLATAERRTRALRQIDGWKMD